MKPNDVLHIVEFEKFIPPFIELTRTRLAADRHHFFFIHRGDLYQPGEKSRIHRLSDYAAKPIGLAVLAKKMNLAGKIVLHGLTHFRLLVLLALQPWLLKKTYWIIWGADLYAYQKIGTSWQSRLKEMLRRFVIPRIGHLVTYVSGDVALARQWYGAKGQHHDCLCYASNVYHHLELPTRNSGSNLQILVGNSADRSNNHDGIFAALLPHLETGLEIHAPLSYGDQQYADEVTKFGSAKFGSKFHALREFMPYGDYLKLLSGIDIAVFNHERQQGMGNIISLLGLGKTVYMRKSTTSWQSLTNLGLTVGNIEDFKPAPLSSELAERNRQIIREQFSETKLVNQWRSILETH
ncbi:4-alpha-L-fucosyltransferase [Leptothrix cholodnii SP-6]|uniref:4-alpha-L-fucosyltransferase n=1 Tax=Leptothrix cholodnii (strain ATCC 51168 / LMG 8142 / SP-6) TaxID=395495 RepID=B1XZR9_LEPCP|nr:TDP-N-acetylfucosamine:lipid II N-acetylfucosaminyltransferase [Leptothrix cholodnii]ACB32915.1 4-alpha-L-fucosyltransferase [Leptothrix cholodnii SP-6]